MAVIPQIDSPYSLDELITGVLEGNADCAIAFYRRYGKRIHHRIRSLLGTDNAHEDIVQTTFLNILDSLSQVRQSASLDHWVDSVTFRTVYKELRRRRYLRMVIPASDNLPDVIDKKNSHRDWVARQFYVALGQMAAEERMMLVLKYVECCTLQEISRISGWSVATVKRRITSAVNSLGKIARADSVLAEYIGEQHDVG